VRPACYGFEVASIEELLRERLMARPDVELAILFGSAARGELRPASDVDLGLRLRCKDRGARHQLLADLERLVHRTLDVVDLDEAPPQLRFEIARDGKLVVERDEGAWSAFRARAFVDWWDFAPIARRVNQAALRRLQERDGTG
jgi:predicted nucleotidyltransferase